MKTVLSVTSASVSLSNDDSGFFRWLDFFFSGVATTLADDDVINVDVDVGVVDEKAEDFPSVVVVV